MTRLDGELELTAASSTVPAAFCWRRGDNGERVTCALCDILAVSSEGHTLLIHHYPLVQARKALDSDGCRTSCLLTARQRRRARRLLAAALLAPPHAAKTCAACAAPARGTRAIGFRALLLRWDCGRAESPLS